MLSERDLIAGRYRLEWRLASGGMSDVWVASDVLLARRVALKVVTPQRAARPGFRQRFQIEARTLAALRHPGIVDIHDYGQAQVGDDQVTYLVMELVDGEPLSERLAALGTMPAGQVMSIVAKTADALQAAHDAGVVHRDVKPANLLLASDGSVVLVDFGIASTSEEIARTANGVADSHADQDGLPGRLSRTDSAGAGRMADGDPSDIGQTLDKSAEVTDAALDPPTDDGETVTGTALYMAPEQAAGRPVSPATDLYSLGVVAYHCLAGRTPFTGDDPTAVAAQHVHDTPPPLPRDVPAAVRALVEQAMARDPTLRFPNAAAMAAAARAAADPTTDQLAVPAAIGTAPLPADTSVQPILRTSAIFATASVEDQPRDRAHRRSGVFAGVVAALATAAVLFAASPAGDGVPFQPTPPADAPANTPSPRIKQPAGPPDGTGSPLPGVESGSPTQDIGPAGPGTSVGPSAQPTPSASPAPSSASPTPDTPAPAAPTPATASSPVPESPDSATTRTADRAVTSSPSPASSPSP